jgi:hypothetical protein
MMDTYFIRVGKYQYSIELANLSNAVNSINLSWSCTDMINMGLLKGFEGKQCMEKSSDSPVM